MTIEEIKEHRYQLEKLLTTHIREFSKVTGIAVESIDVRNATYGDGSLELISLTVNLERL